MRLITEIVLIAAGASLGALSRHFLGAVYSQFQLPDVHAVLVVNTVGCMLLAVLLAASAHYFFLNQAMRLLMLTGFLSSMTTFSTVMLQWLTFMGKHQWLTSVQYIVVHIAIPVAAMAMVMWLSHFIFNHIGNG